MTVSKPSPHEDDDLRTEAAGYDDTEKQVQLRRVQVARHAPDVKHDDPLRPVLAEANDATRDDGHPLLAKRDEILVSDEDIRDDPGFADELARIGYQRDDKRSTRGVQLFVFSRGQDPDFAGRFDESRAQGRRSFPNLLCSASQPKMKGGAGPHPAPRYLPPLGDQRIGAGVSVAVIDTGLWDDAERRGDGWLDGVPESRTNIDPLDVIEPHKKLLDFGAGHGTFVAGLIRQVAPGTDVSIIRALDSDGVGTDESVANAIRDAGRQGVDIIHLSLAGPGFAGEPPPLLSAEIAALPRRTVVVAAAGNEGTDEPMYPAALPNVVAVGALTRGLQRAKWSSHGRWVDVWAVGEGAISTFVHGRASDLDGTPKFEWNPKLANPIAMWSGTSYAAPQVTGRIAAIMTTTRRRWFGLFPRPLRAQQAYDNLVRGATVLPGIGAFVEALDFTVEHPATPDTDRGLRL